MSSYYISVLFQIFSRISGKFGDSHDISDSCFYFPMKLLYKGNLKVLLEVLDFDETSVLTSYVYSTAACNYEALFVRIL